MTEKKVTVKILGDASDFRDSIKKVEKVQKRLGKVKEASQKQGLAYQKQIDKVLKKHNKSQSKSVKEALKQEKALKKAIQDNLKAIKAKQRAHKGSVASIEQEVKAIRKLQKAYKEVHEYRTRTQDTSGARAFGRAGRVGRQALGGVSAVAQIAVGSILGTLQTQLTSAIRSGWASYNNFGRAAAGLSGTGARLPGLFNKERVESLLGPSDIYKLTGFRRSNQLGFSATETLQHMRSVARQTGGGRGLLGQAQMAQAYARGYGGDVGAVGGFMGQLTRAQGSFRKREFQVVMQQAFTTGMDKSRTGEAMSAMGQAIQSAASVSGGRVDAAGVTAMLAYLGQKGGPALQGQRGMRNLGMIDQTLKSHGALSANGEAVKAFLLQSMGFGLAGGDSADFLSAAGRLQQGVFGKGGARNLVDIVRSTMAYSGGNIDTAGAGISAMTGISMDVANKIIRTVSAGGDRDQMLADIQELTEQERPIEEQIRDVIQEGNTVVAERIARLDDRLVGIGRSTYDSITKMEDVMNSMVDTLLPVAVSALKHIADLIVDLWDTVKEFRINWLENESETEELARLERQKENIVQQLRRGDITPEAAQAQLIQVANEATASNLRMNRDVGLIDTFLGMEQLGAEVLRLQGIRTGDTELEERGRLTSRAEALNRDAIGLANSASYGPVAQQAARYQTLKRQMVTAFRTSGGESGTVTEARNQRMRQLLAEVEFYRAAGREATPEEIARLVASEAARAVTNREWLADGGDVAAYRAAIAQYAETTTATGRVDGGD